jgi:hypothetical protein
MIANGQRFTSNEVVGITVGVPGYDTVNGLASAYRRSQVIPKQSLTIANPLEVNQEGARLVFPWLAVGVGVRNCIHMPKPPRKASLVNGPTRRLIENSSVGV